MKISRDLRHWLVTTHELEHALAAAGDQIQGFKLTIFLIYIQRGRESAVIVIF